MRLLNTEIRRFWSRRITWITILVTGVLMLIGTGIGFTQSSAAEPTTGSTIMVDDGCVRNLIQAREDGDEEFQGLSDEEIEDLFCTFTEGNSDRRFFATDILGGFGFEDWDTYRANLDRTATQVVDGEQFRSAKRGFEGVIPTIAVFFLILAVVMGGSFVGAEYRAGTVENLLLWEPRRIRVIVAKYLVGFLSSFVVMVIVLLVLTGLLLIIANFRGTFQGVNGRFWLDWVFTVIRAGLMSGCFFVLAMAIANIARNTTAAVVALLGWFVVSNILIDLLARGIRHYELFNNTTAVISRAEISRVVGPFNDQPVFTHGPWTAGLIVALWSLVPAAIATWLFQRRDIS